MQPLCWGTLHIIERQHWDTYKTCCMWEKPSKYLATYNTPCIWEKPATQLVYERNGQTWHYLYVKETTTHLVRENLPLQFAGTFVQDLEKLLRELCNNVTPEMTISDTNAVCCSHLTLYDSWSTVPSSTYTVTTMTFYFTYYQVQFLIVCGILQHTGVDNKVD